MKFSPVLLADATARGVRLAVDVHGPALGLIIEQARPEVIKINRYEAFELIGAEVGDLADLGPAVQARGAVDVVITDGAAGSIGWDRSGAGWRAVTQAAPGGYPVGSGDCFLAGLVSELAPVGRWPRRWRSRPRWERPMPRSPAAGSSSWRRLRGCERSP